MMNLLVTLNSLDVKVLLFEFKLFGAQIVYIHITAQGILPAGPMDTEHCTYYKHVQCLIFLTTDYYCYVYSYCNQ